MFVVATVTDLKNPLLNLQAVPLYVGAAVFMVATAFGWTQFVLNPFRDFGPRVVR